MTHRLTFVIPAFKAAATLPRTLRSLQAQTAPDWRAIVIDDGSPDDTAAVAAAFARADDRISVLRQPNSGVCHARNAGLAAARTDWIAFLDSDDWVSPSFAEALLEAAGRSSADFAYCGYERIAPDGKVVMQSLAPDLAERGFEVVATRCPIAIHCAVARRSLIEAAGGFDPDLEVCEEWDLWQRVFRRGARATFVPSCLAHYEVRPGSLSRNGLAMLRDGLTVLRRGHAADPRVSEPAPACRDGLSAEDYPVRATNLAAWCAAEAVARGQPGVGFLKLLDCRPDDGGYAQALADTIVEALAIGAARPPAELVGIEAQFRPRLQELVEALTRDARTGAGRGLNYAIERALLLGAPPGLEADLPLTKKAVVDLAAPRPLTPAPGQDQAMLELASQGRILARVEIPLLGPMSPGDLAELARWTLGEDAFLEHSRARRDWRFWGALPAPELAVAFGRAAARRLRGRRGGLQPVLRAAEVRAALAVAGRRGGHAHRDIVAAEVLRLRGEAGPDLIDGAAGEPHRPQAARSPALSADSPAFWDQVFEREDPWDYANDYEQEKYARTLDILEGEAAGRALELGCAEGHFTRQLAPRVRHLLATDISGRALERAESRCKGLANVSFRQLDVIADELPTGLDLITCSEMLYFLDRDRLEEVADRIAAALAPGGRLVMANHFLLKDDLSRTGFDWEQPYGGKVIHEVFRRKLALERSFVTELYRVDCFRRAGGATARAPEIRELPVTARLTPRVAQHVVWGGATAIRSEALREEVSWSVPVLAYHRIAEDGPAALKTWRVSVEAFRSQIRALRSAGYYSTTSADIAAALRERRPLPGRPVLITFDDAYQDFADVAWPILRDHGFSAEVFVVAGKVGGTADWDAAFGPPAPLMDWPTIRALSGEGVSFGSHMHSHVPATNLGSLELLQEAVLSKAALERELGRPVVAVAAPYGARNARYDAAVRHAGYALSYTCEFRHVDLHGDAFHLPRLEVDGSWSLEDFRAALAAAQPGRSAEAQPSVAVVIPAYNAADTIGATLASVRAQTYRNLEIIVVDDGSSDGTVEVVEAHAASDPRIRLVRQANGGVARARNTGIAAASSELIAPIDADDLWAPSKIEKQVRALQGRPDVGLVYTWYAAIDGSGRVVDAGHSPGYEGDVLRYVCRNNMVGNGSSPLMRKQAVLEAGGYEPALRDARAQGCEDLLLYFRIARRHRFALVREHLTGYRQTTEAMSSDVMQMLRSYRMVAQEMRAACPQYAADVVYGEAQLSHWLLWKALKARRLRSAAELFGVMALASPTLTVQFLTALARWLLSRGKGAGGPGRLFHTGRAALETVA